MRLGRRCARAHMIRAARSLKQRIRAHPRSVSRSSQLGSAEPIAWSGPGASGPIGRIGEVTSVNRKAAAADALGQPVSEALELGDLLVDPLRPLAGETRPVAAGGDAIGRKPGELRADLL